MAGLRLLSPMLHPQCHHRQRTVRGQSYWLGFLCWTLSFLIPSRFIPALSETFSVSFAKYDGEIRSGLLALGFLPFEINGAILHGSEIQADHLGLSGEFILRHKRIVSLKTKRQVGDPKGGYLVCNVGGPGFFSRSEERPEHYEKVVPQVPPFFDLVLPGESDVVLRTGRFSDLARIDPTAFNPGIVFVPESRHLISIPATGGPIVLRQIESSSESRETLRITSSEKDRAVRGESFQHQLSFIGSPQSIGLADSPPGATLDESAGLLSWDVPDGFVANDVVFTVKVRGTDGKRLSHSIRVLLGAAETAALTKGAKYASIDSKREFETANDSIAVKESTFVSELTIRDAIPAAGGELLALTFENSNRLDLVDIKKAQVIKTVYLPADCSLITANKKAIFCYYPAHGIIERRNVKDLSVEKATHLSLTIPLTVLETGPFAEDGLPLFACRQSRIRESTHLACLIDSQTLQLLPPSVDVALHDSWIASHMLLNRNISGHFTVSLDGRAVLGVGSVVQIGDRQPRHVLRLQGVDEQKASLSAVGASVFTRDGQTLIPSGSQIDRKDRKLAYYKFDESGETLVGWTFYAMGTTGRRAVVEFFSKASTQPMLTLQKLGEFDNGPFPNSSQQESYGNVLKPIRRVYFFSGINRLITIPFDNRQVVIREIDVGAAVAKLK